MNLYRLIMAMAFTVTVIPAMAESSAYHDFSDEHLRFGKVVWLLNCETCHAYGVADAPVPMQPDEWRMRVTKPRGTLYEHAIDGYFGPDHSMMPARGGNENLSDKQVKAAVDYMVELANFYIKSERK